MTVSEGLDALKLFAGFFVALMVVGLMFWAFLSSGVGFRPGPGSIPRAAREKRTPAARPSRWPRRRQVDRTGDADKNN